MLISDPPCHSSHSSCISCWFTMAMGNSPPATTSPTVLSRRPISSRRSSSSADNFGFRALFITLLVLLICGSLGLSAAAQVVTGPPNLMQHKLSHGPAVDNLDQGVHRSSHVGKSAGELQRFFEVSVPLTTSNRKRPVQSIQLLYHEFADTYGVPPATAQYKPSKKIKKKWDKVVLKWSAVCRGRQFDRIAAVWLGGVEILRTCTAEPTEQGIIWDVEKDVTRYSSLWMEPQEVVVSLGNVVDSTYTGIFNVTVSVEFYEGDADRVLQREEQQEGFEVEEDDDDDEEELYSSSSFDKREYSDRPADVILPISEPTYIDGGYWFQLSSETDVKNTSLQIPNNSYRALLEVCVSPHGNDEFWYTNPPNTYLEANNITNIPGNGSFREVVVSIDDKVVGAVWPFPVLYTGGVNPLFWRPAAAIGAFNLPSYDFDISPFVGYLLDGKNHTFSLTVTDALYVWLLQANLHIWVDRERHRTTGSLTEYLVPSYSPALKSKFQGLDGTFKTKASRTLSYVGYVASSFGNLTTSSSYSLKFSNTLVFANQSDLSTVDQLTETEGMVVVKTAKKEISLDRTAASYPFYLYYLQITNPDTSIDIHCTLVHSLKEDSQSLTKKSSSFSFLRNSQSSIGELFISVNNTISGIGATDQNLSFESTDVCYERTIRAKNYTVLYDSSTSLCSHTT